MIPCRPTPADLRAFKPTLAAIYRLEKRFAFVLNQTPPRSYRNRDAADGLAVLGVLPDVNIVMRNDHQDAIGMGQGVTEFNPAGDKPPRKSGVCGAGLKSAATSTTRTRVRPSRMSKSA